MPDVPMLGVPVPGSTTDGGKRKTKTTISQYSGTAQHSNNNQPTCANNGNARCPHTRCLVPASWAPLGRKETKLKQQLAIVVVQPKTIINNQPTYANNCDARCPHSQASQCLIPELNPWQKKQKFSSFQIGDIRILQLPTANWRGP